jgi:hypothetical protein
LAQHFVDYRPQIAHLFACLPSRRVDATGCCFRLHTLNSGTMEKLLNKNDGAFLTFDCRSNNGNFAHKLSGMKEFPGTGLPTDRLECMLPGHSGD